MKCKILARCASDLQITCKERDIFCATILHLQEPCKKCASHARSVQVMQGKWKFLARFACIAWLARLARIKDLQENSSKKTDIFCARILQAWTCKTCRLFFPGILHAFRYNITQGQSTKTNHYVYTGMELEMWMKLNIQTWEWTWNRRTMEIVTYNTHQFSSQVKSYTPEGRGDGDTYRVTHTQGVIMTHNSNTQGVGDT